MGGLGDCRPAMAMVGVQFFYAGVSLLTRAALVQGMSPRVIVVYSKAIATLVIAPIAYFSRRKPGGTPLGLRSFSLMFLASFIGISISQNLYFEGLYLASSSIGSAMGNLVPAITFIMAFLCGLEKINIRSLRSIARIVGTVVCVGGAISMALLRGPKVLNAPILGSGSENWLLGCLFLFASSCSWASWLILQVPVTASYPDHLSGSAWMCFLSTIQSATYTIFIDQDPDAWTIHSNLELVCCLFAGIIGSALAFFIQAWCISQRGPLFSAMFSPLCTVIVTIFAALFLHEEIYSGSLLGAVGVIFGLYVVLWGKAKDYIKSEEEINPNLETDQTKKVKILVEESADEGCKNIDLEEPLLSDKSNDNDENV